MPASSLVVNLVQYDILWEQPEPNLQKLDELIEGAGIPPTSITILPEMFTTGFTMNAPAMAESMDGDSITWMQEKAKALQGDLVGSLIIKEEEKFFNRTIWMAPEGIKGSYDKHHLFTMAGEDKAFTRGNKKMIVPFADWRCTTFICYDVRFPVWSWVGKEADLMIYMANFPEKRIDAWRQLLVARAIENQCYTVGVNRIGWDGKQHYYNGQSIVVDPMGEVLMTLADEETVGSVTLDGVALKIIRDDLPFLNDADVFQINSGD